MRAALPHKHKDEPSDAADCGGLGNTDSRFP